MILSTDALVPGTLAYRSRFLRLTLIAAVAVFVGLVMLACGSGGTDVTPESEPPDGVETLTPGPKKSPSPTVAPDLPLMTEGDDINLYSVHSIQKDRNDTVVKLKLETDLPTVIHPGGEPRLRIGDAEYTPSYNRGEDSGRFHVFKFESVESSLASAVLHLPVVQHEVLEPTAVPFGGEMELHPPYGGRLVLDQENVGVRHGALHFPFEPFDGAAATPSGVRIRVGEDTIGAKSVGYSYSSDWTLSGMRIRFPQNIRGELAAGAPVLEIDGWDVMMTYEIALGP